MLIRFSGVLLSVLLAATLLWGWCPFCPLVLPAHDSAHDCCKHPGTRHCGMPASQQPDGKKCPNQSYALESYAKVEVDAGQAPAFLPSISWYEALREREVVVGLPSDLPQVHAPPDLYLRNSTLLI